MFVLSEKRGGNIQSELGYHRLPQWCGSLDQNHYGKTFHPRTIGEHPQDAQGKTVVPKGSPFAFAMMREEYPQYTHENFCDDLRYRTKRRRKRGKSQLLRYGRYRRMELLKEQFRQTGNSDFALQAQKLYTNMTKPYRVLARVSGKLGNIHSPG